MFRRWRFAWLLPESVKAVAEKGEKVPMVVFYHGGSDNPSEGAEMSRFHELGRKEKFITVYPWGSNTANWNINYEGTPSADSCADEKFGVLLIDYMLANYPVDPERVYLSGFSNGAAKMATTMGLNVADDKISLMASAEISVENQDGTVNVKIPMTETPDTSRYTYYVLHFDVKNNKWETVKAQITSDGIVIAAFDSLSPVFVVRADAKLPAADNGDDNNNGDNNNGGDNGGSDNGSSDSSSNSGSSSNASGNSSKAGTAPASITPSNPGVSPKTGE